MTITPYYDRGGVTIYHGDSRDVLPELPSASTGFVLTDPPYLVGFTGRWGESQAPIAGDLDPAWLEPVFREVWRLLKPDRRCASFYGWPHADLFLSAWKRIGFRPVSHLAFVKNVWGFGRFTRSQHESAYLLAKGRPALPEAAISDTIEWTREQDAFHPNQKPVAALLPLVGAYSEVGEVVLDPFMGSGSTLRAANDLGRRAVGIEIEECYCELAARRMEQGVLFLAAIPRRDEVRSPTLFDQAGERPDGPASDTAKP
jgi:site-specific DNA-methyltransferase (adenine-specific)